MEREEAVPTRPPAAGHPRTAADADPFGPQGHTCYPHRPGWPPPPLPSSSAAALAGGEPTAAMRAAWGSGGGERFVRGEKRRRRRREIGGGNSSPWWGRSFFFSCGFFFWIFFVCVCILVSLGWALAFIWRAWWAVTFLCFLLFFFSFLFLFSVCYFLELVAVFKDIFCCLKDVLFEVSCRFFKISFAILRYSLPFGSCYCLYSILDFSFLDYIRHIEILVVLYECCLYKGSPFIYWTIVVYFCLDIFEVSDRKSVV